MDGYNSMVRYYKNNFADGYRQDSIDLFLGNYIVDSREGISIPSPLRPQSVFKSLPLILAVILAMMVLTFYLPTSSTHAQAGYLLFWIAVLFVTWRVVIMFGNEFVDMPRLCAPPFQTSTQRDRKKD
eukprot:Colp12_sorted_trinity150504_noHs@15757